MKNEDLKRYFNKIKEGIGGNNVSNSEIIDYANGKSIDIKQIEDEYYKYKELEEEIDNYINDEYLDSVNDSDKIKAHIEEFGDIDMYAFFDKIKDNIFLTDYNFIDNNTISAKEVKKSTVQIMKASKILEVLKKQNSII